MSTALGIGNHLAEKFLGGEDADPSLQQLNSLLNEIAGLNQLAGETRQRWEAQRRVPGRQLSSVLSRLEAAIRRLIDNLAQAEEYARQAPAAGAGTGSRGGRPTDAASLRGLIPPRNPPDGDPCNHRPLTTDERQGRIRSPARRPAIPPPARPAGR